VFFTNCFDSKDKEREKNEIVIDDVTLLLRRAVDTYMTAHDNQHNKFIAVWQTVLESDTVKVTVFEIHVLLTDFIITSYLSFELVTINPKTLCKQSRLDFKCCLFSQ